MWRTVLWHAMQDLPPRCSPTVPSLCPACPACLPACSQYQGEQPGHELPAKEAGNCVLAICQAAAMTHLLIGPAGAAPASARKQAAAALAGRGRTPTRAGEEASVHSVHSVQQPRGASPGTASADGTATPQWTVQQEEVAAAMQAVLAALTSHSPAESVSAGQRRARRLRALPCRLRARPCVAAAPHASAPAASAPSPCLTPSAAAPRRCRCWRRCGAAPRASWTCWLTRVLGTCACAWGLWLRCVCVGMRAAERHVCCCPFT